MPNRVSSSGVDASFGARLRRLRTAHGLTQEEFGRKVGLSKRMVAYYEIQRGTPSAVLLTKFARALRVSLDELMGTDGDGTAETPQTTSELRLWRRLRRVQSLPDRDRRVVLQLIDSLVERTARRSA